MLLLRWLLLMGWTTHTACYRSIGIRTESISCSVLCLLLRLLLLLIL